MSLVEGRFTRERISAGNKHVCGRKQFFSRSTDTTDRLCHFPGALDDIDVLATDRGLGNEATHAS